MKNLELIFKKDIMLLYEHPIETIKDFKEDVFSYDEDNEAFLLINNCINNINNNNNRYILNGHLMNF
jgi:hypothetical protein